MLKLSTLAYGTYMGNPDDLTDYKMYDAIKQCVISGGINHIDTAPNYRYMKSERTIGKILTTLESKYNISRDQLFIATKAGYVPEDAENMVLRTEMIQNLVQTHKVPAEAFQKESGHSMHPAFIERQLTESLERMNLECVDLLYIQNPYEAQGPYNTDNVFFERLKQAFDCCEKLVAAGKIKNYGISTYSSLRTKPTEYKMHLNLQKVHRLAQSVVGEGSKHHFNFVQAPVNVIMPEALVEQWQAIEDSNAVSKNKALVQACAELELNLVTSQPLVQGLAATIPLSRVAVPGIYNLTARHLQMLRSIPSKSVLSTVVGMKEPDHVRQNLEVIKRPLLTRDEFMAGIKPVKRSEFIEDALDF